MNYLHYFASIKKNLLPLTNFTRNSGINIKRKRIYQVPQ